MRFNYIRHLEAISHVLWPLNVDPGITCRVLSGVKPMRDANSAYYVDQESYPNESYPDYCSSYFTIFTNETVNQLLVGHEMYKDEPWAMGVRLEFVHLGILANEIGIKVVDGKEVF